MLYNSNWLVLFSFLFLVSHQWPDLLSRDRQIPIIRRVLVQTTAPCGMADNNSRHLLLDRRDLQETKETGEEEWRWRRRRRCVGAKIQLLFWSARPLVMQNVKILDWIGIPFDQDLVGTEFYIAGNHLSLKCSTFQIRRQNTTFSAKTSAGPGWGPARSGPQQGRGAVPQRLGTASPSKIRPLQVSSGCLTNTSFNENQPGWMLTTKLNWTEIG